MRPLNNPNKKRYAIFALLAVLLVVLSVVAYQLVLTRTNAPKPKVVVHKPTPGPTPSPTPSPTPMPTPFPTLPIVQDSRQIMGVEGDANSSYPGISWVRLAYPTCGSGHLAGNTLKQTVARFHMRGIHVLLTVCQGPNDSRLYKTGQLTDAAQGHADAVQCGNEQMKYDPAVAFLYIPPERFARFYDACERAMHAVRAGIPVLLGSLDPHVGGVDFAPLYNQVDYLNQMEHAMNSLPHRKGYWNWHRQTLGLIDSWHNGWNNGAADSSVNSLYGLFTFWAQQFNVDLNSGQLGKHLWVVEGTGCFKGCGVDPYSSYQVATSHIIALITDAQTARSYRVPLFYFSGQDFFDQGINWPIGIQDVGGHAKPLRQDLAMGARTLTMSCSSRRVIVSNQEDLLAKLYQGCALPGDYVNTLFA
jgi:hypothetical protein